MRTGIVRLLPPHRFELLGFWLSFPNIERPTVVGLVVLPEPDRPRVDERLHLRGDESPAAVVTVTVDGPTGNNPSTFAKFGFLSAAATHRRHHSLRFHVNIDRIELVCLVAVARLATTASCVPQLPIGNLFRWKGKFSVRDFFDVRHFVLLGCVVLVIGLRLVALFLCQSFEDRLRARRMDKQRASPGAPVVPAVVGIPLIQLLPSSGTQKKTYSFTRRS